VQPPIPAFTGPVAHLSMTEIARGAFAANVAIVKKINGQDFKDEIYPAQPPPDTPLNPLTGTLSTVDIPAGPGTYSVAGYSIFQAPIFALAMDEYCIVGDIKFTPVANANYILEGKFTPAYSALWIQDATTNAIEGNKIEIHGSATVNKWSLLASSAPCY
jgi:hypothetical protein